MSYAPCKNPSCPSYGKPHPNCQCNLEMAKGGMVPEGLELEEESPTDAQAESSLPEGLEIVEEQPEKKNSLPEGLEFAEKNYSTPAQQALTIAEGAAQGVPILGPLATKAELSLGVPAEDITGRAEANPWQHGLSKASTAIGTTLIPAVAGARVAGMGAAALQGFLTQAGMQASDEVTNYMLGQGDPDHPVGSAILHSGAAGLLGLVGGGIAGKINSKLASLAEENIGSKIHPFLEGIASAASGKPISSLAEEADIATKLAGSKFYQGIMHTLMPHIGAGVGATEGALEGYHENGVIGAGKGLLTGAAIGAVADLLGRPVVSRLTDALGKNAVAPFIAKILSSGSAQGLGDAINYATSVGGGLKTLDKSIDILFKGGSSAGQQTFENMFKNDASHEKELEDYLDNGGFQQNIDHTIQQENQQKQVPHFAEGGDVQPMKQPPPPKQTNKGIYQNPGVAQHFPTQNTLMTTARARVSNYLMSLKPDQYAPRLPFDDPPDQTQQNKSYKKALKIALNPMQIMKDIHQGTIEPEDLTHFNSLYPETASLIKNQLTKKIVQSNLDGKKPPYHVRQGLSLFLGTNLSSDTDPTHIQSAQATFIKPQGQQQDRQRPKSIKGSQALQKIANGYMTQTQARAQRQQKS